MKKVSTKWKIFWVASYLQMIIMSGLFFLFASLLFKKNADIIIVGIVMAILLIPIMNSGLNIQVMHRYFPDQSVPKSIRKSITTTSIITAVIWLLLLAMCIISFFSEITVRQTYPDYNNTGLIGTICVFLDWLLGLYLLIFQLELTAVMDKNSKATMHEMIESIGKK